MIVSRRAPRRNPSNTPIYLRGRPIGHVQDGVFVKTLSKRRHFLKRPPAIAFDRSTLRDAQAAGAVRVRITDRDSGDTYEAAMDDILTYGFPVRRGFGDQVALPLERWTVNGVEPVHTFASNEERIKAQPSLFDDLEAQP